MPDDFFVSRHGKKLGPFTKDQLVNLGATGKIDPTDSVFVPTRGEWIAASEIRGLIPVAESIPVATAPPAASSEVLKETPIVITEGIAPPPLPSSISLQHRPFILGIVAVTSCLGLGLGLMKLMSGPTSLETVAPQAGKRVSGPQSQSGKPPVAVSTSGGFSLSRLFSGSLDSNYVRIAQILSNSYSQGGKPPASNPSEVESSLKELESASSVVIRNAVAHLNGGRQLAVEAKEKVKKAVRAADQNAMDVLGSAIRGEYVQTYEVERVITRSDGSTQIVRSTESVDESTFPMLGAGLMAGLVRSKAPGESKRRAEFALEKGRMNAWGELLTHLDSFYPSRSSQANLIIPRASSPNRNGKAAAFALVNSSGRDLTNVTVKVDLVHFLSVPEPLARQVYFVANWAAGRSIDLPTGFVENLTVENPQGGRPIITIPAYRAENGGKKPSAKDIWLKGIGGVVEFRIAAWSMELRQNEASAIVPELVELAGDYEMDHAFGLSRLLYLGAFRRETKAKENPKGRSSITANRNARKKAEPKAEIPIAVKIPPEGFGYGALDSPREWSLRTAKRVAAFAPEGTAIYREAQAYIANPNKYVRTRMVRELESSAAQVQEGKRWSGDWSFELVSVPPLAGNEIRKALADFKDKTGLLTLTIDQFDKDTYTFTGTITIDGKKDRAREVTGLVDFEGITFQTPRPQFASKVPVLDLDANGVAFRINKDENYLVGVGTTLNDAYNKNYQYNLTLSPAK